MEIGLLEKTATLFNTCFKIGAHCVYYPSRYDTYRRTPRDRAAVGCGDVSVKPHYAGRLRRRYGYSRERNN